MPLQPEAQLALLQQGAVQQQQLQAAALQQQQQENHMAILRAAAIHEYNASLMQQQHASLCAGLSIGGSHNAPPQQQQQQQLGGVACMMTSSGCHSIQPQTVSHSMSVEQLQHKILADSGKVFAESVRMVSPPAHAFSSPPSFHTDSGVSSFSCGAVVGGGSNRSSFDAELSSLQRAAIASAAAAAALLPLSSAPKRVVNGSQILVEQGACFADMTGGVTGIVGEIGGVAVPALGMVSCSSMLKLIEAASNSQEGSLLRVALTGAGMLV